MRLCFQHCLLSLVFTGSAQGCREWSIRASPAGSLLGCCAEKSVGKGAGRVAGSASPTLGLWGLGVVRGGSRSGVGGAASPGL